MNAKQRLINALNVAFDRMLLPTFTDYSSTLRPMLFIQEPFAGTHAMVFLREIGHPTETTACMTTIHSAIEDAGFEGCVIANDLTTLEINLDNDFTQEWEPVVENVNRIELMERFSTDVSATLSQYADGLTSDVECTCILLETALRAHAIISRCKYCGTTEGTLSHTAKDIDGRNVPCCRNCFMQHEADFECIWGKGYINHKDLLAAKTERHVFSFFTEKNGYSEDDVKAIQALELGEAYTMNDHGPHTVVRIK